MAQKKYKLLPVENIVPSVTGWNTGTMPMYRIQALRDIRGTGVKRGDIGGYVSDANILSHEGTCWISDDAQVLGHVKILEDAQIKDNVSIVCRWSNNSITIKGRTCIRNNAEVVIARDRNAQEAPIHTVITGSVSIINHALVKNLGQASGSVHISNHASIHGTTLLKGTITIRDYAEVKKGVQVLGVSSVTDKSIIHDGAKIVDCNVSDDAQIGKDQIFIDRDFDERGLYVNEEVVLPTITVDEEGNTSTEKASKAVPDSNPAAKLFNEIKSGITSYESDIVKIIKYPAMVDQSIEQTLEMTIALKKAIRLSEDVSTPEFANAVEELERKFLVAESNALKISSSMLSDADKKKTSLAKDLFSIATNEASSEQEKKSAFKQGFKQLEGVLTVPETAIDTFRVKLGLAELEA